MSLFIGESTYTRWRMSVPNVENDAIIHEDDSSQPLGQRSNHCRSRKSVRGHFSLHDLHPVYIPYFLQVLSLPYFTSTTPNKDQQKEQLFYYPFVLDLYPGDAHGLRGSRLAACVFHAPRKTPRGKSGRNWFAWADYHDSGTNL